jgi:hypothetical protein
MDWKLFKNGAAGLGKASGSRNSPLCPGGRTCPGGMGTPRGKSERRKVWLRIRRLDDLHGTLDRPKAQLMQCPLCPRKRTSPAPATPARLTPEPRKFAEQHHLDMHTPLLSIARQLKCTHCNERKAHCWPEPDGIEMDDRSHAHNSDDPLDREPICN